MCFCEPALGCTGTAGQDGPVDAHVHSEPDYVLAGISCLGLGGLETRLWAFLSTQQTLPWLPAPHLPPPSLQQSLPFCLNSSLITIYTSFVSVSSRDNMYGNFSGRERQSLSKISQSREFFPRFWIDPTVCLSLIASPFLPTRGNVILNFRLIIPLYFFIDFFIVLLPIYVSPNILITFVHFLT